MSRLVVPLIALIGACGHDYQLSRVGGPDEVAGPRVDLRVDVDRLDFGGVPVGCAVEDAVTVYNFGDAVEDLVVELDGPVVDVELGRVSLAPGEGRPVPVRLAPTGDDHGEVEAVLWLIPEHPAADMLTVEITADVIRQPLWSRGAVDLGDQGADRQPCGDWRAFGASGDDRRVR